MALAGQTTRLKLIHGHTGNTLTQTDEDRRADQLEHLIEILEQLCTGAAYDGTLFEGFTVSAGAGLSINVAAGYGLIDGIPIYASGVTAKSGLADSSTLYIFLKLAATSYYDRSFTVEAQVGAPPLADAICIAKVTTAGGAVTVVDNAPVDRTPRLRVPGLPSTLRVVALSGAEYTSPKTAIEACRAGDTVLILPGTYTETAVITVPANNITILGLNREATIVYNSTADGGHVLNLNGKNSLTVRGLTLSAVAGKTGYGITTAASSDLLIEDVYITGAGLVRGISLDTSGSRNQIRFCRIEISYYAVVFVGQADPVCVFNRLQAAVNNSASYVVYLATTTGARIAKNIIVSSTAGAGGGMRLIGACSRCQIISNAMSGAGLATGIWIDATGGNPIDDQIALNRIEATGTCIYLFTTNPATITDFLVNDNWCSGTLGVHVVDVRVSYTRIYCNALRNCTTGITDAGTGTVQANNT